LSEAWKALTPEEKVQYEKSSEINRDRYHSAMEKYKKDLAEYHTTYGLDEDAYDVDHPEGPRLRKVRLSEMALTKKLSRDEEGEEEAEDGRHKIQHMVQDRLLGPNQPRLFNKVVIVKPKANAAHRAEWLRGRRMTIKPAITVVPYSSSSSEGSSPSISSRICDDLLNSNNINGHQETVTNAASVGDDEPPPPPPYQDVAFHAIPSSQEEAQYYFTLTYIPDLQWCRLAPLQEAGTFLSGMSKKKGYEKHLGRTRWVLAPESVGREIDISASRCLPVSRAIPVKNVSDADKEEWDILDDIRKA
jgi:hypothetical protein